MGDDLKPCPFCGGEIVAEFFDDPDDPTFVLTCDPCIFQKILSMREPDAMAWWNRRPGEDHLKAELEKARLIWTRETPTEPGWYWACGGRAGDRTAVVEVGVYRGPTRMLAVRIQGVWCDLGCYLKWAGPLSQPTEEKS
jgi:Lar family restriction alleviation protein